MVRPEQAANIKVIYFTSREKGKPPPIQLPPAFFHSRAASPPSPCNSPTRQLFLSLSALPPSTPACSPLLPPPLPPHSPTAMALFFCCAAFGRETPVWRRAGVRLAPNARVSAQISRIRRAVWTVGFEMSCAVFLSCFDPF